jgi:hypothetical protein
VKWRNSHAGWPGLAVDLNAKNLAAGDLYRRAPTPIFDEAGELVGAVNMLVDLTDRKRSDEYSQRLASDAPG